MFTKDARYQGLNSLLPWFKGLDLLNRARALAIRQIDLCCRFMDIHPLLDTVRGGLQLFSRKTTRRILTIHKAIECSFSLVGETEQWNRDAEFYWATDKQARSGLSTPGNAMNQEFLIDHGMASSIALMRSSQLLFSWELMCCLEKLNELSTLSLSKVANVDILFPVAWLQERISQSILDIISLIPSALRAFNGGIKPPTPIFNSTGLEHLVIWPVYAVAQCPLSTQDQVSYSRQILQDLGSVIGVYTTYHLLNTQLFSTTAT
jgi:hypothetical protein